MRATHAGRTAGLLVAALLFLGATAPPAASAGPAPSASVSLDESVYTASLYQASSDVWVFIAGTVSVHSEIGHWVSLELTVTGTTWSWDLSPSTVTRQTDDEVRFTGSVLVPRGAAQGRYALQVRAEDSDNLFPIHEAASFDISVFRGPLALDVSLATAPPRPGGSATWSLTLRNLAAFDIDYDPVFEQPAGFSNTSSGPSTQVVAAGGQVRIFFTLTVPASAAPGAYEWSALVVSLGHPEATSSVVVPFEVQAIVAPPPNASPDFLALYWLPLSLGLAALGVALFFSLTEVGYLALAFSVVAPLFSRLRRDKVLDNFTRGQIYGFVRANPGAHYSAVQQTLDVENGVLAYHLRVLLREGYLVARNEGVYKRFYPRDYKIPKRRALLTRLQVDILEEVGRRPGTSQRALAAALGESKQVVSYNVGVLREAGMLSGERHGRDVLLRPAQGGPAASSEGPEEGPGPTEPADLAPS